MRRVLLFGLALVSVPLALAVLAMLEREERMREMRRRIVR